MNCLPCRLERPQDQSTSPRWSHSSLRRCPEVILHPVGSSENISTCRLSHNEHGWKHYMYLGQCGLILLKAGKSMYIAYHWSKSRKLFHKECSSLLPSCVCWETDPSNSLFPQMLQTHKILNWVKQFWANSLPLREEILRKKLLFFWILSKLPLPRPPNLDNLYHFFLNANI